MYSMEKLQKLQTIEEHAPAATQAFWAFDKAAMSDAALSGRVKELIALGVALTTQCPYCIEIHAGRARQAGAAEAELAEVVTVAAALRAGAAMTHGAHIFAGA